MVSVQNSTGNASCAVDFGSNIVWTSGWNMFMWKIWLAPSTIGTRAAGGLVFIIGSDVNNFREWNTGSDYGSYPYGGWQNFAVNPE
jgi:Na+/melibiose symporter-like transporter